MRHSLHFGSNTVWMLTKEVTREVMREIIRNQWYKDI